MSKRLSENSFAKGKYDATQNQDLEIIKRVEEIATQREVSMTEVSLAWLLSKVSSPVVGATKPHHIDGAAKAVQLKLTQKEVEYLDELYQSHQLVGVMAKK